MPEQCWCTQMFPLSPLFSGLLDAISKMFKYKEKVAQAKMGAFPGAAVGGDPGAQMFLAQRNIYITGFSLFLLLWVSFCFLFDSYQCTPSTSLSLWKGKSSYHNSGLLLYHLFAPLPLVFSEPAFVLDATYLRHLQTIYTYILPNHGFFVHGEWDDFKHGASVCHVVFHCAEWSTAWWSSCLSWPRPLHARRQLCSKLSLLQPRLRNWCLRMRNSRWLRQPYSFVCLYM